MIYKNGYWLFAACVITALTDHFFFYIPVVDDTYKCVGTDKKFQYAALILRSLTNILFIVDMIYQICEASKLVSKAKLQTGGKLKTCKYLEHVKIIDKKLS